MSSKIDDRIVNMQFNNGQFQKGISETTSSLGELKKALDMGKVADGVQTIASKFSAIGAVAFSALQRATNAAISAGVSMANALIEPIIAGGKKRALAIEQAKFQFRGLGMDVDATMAAALAAVKGTAFGLDEAASAAANFGASGVSLESIAVALKGISGVAALSGSQYADIADVFSKVAGQGRLMGDDLNRLAARGVNAAATLGKALGKTEAEVRDMVGKGQISFDLFSSAMNDAFGEHATKASDTFAGAAANFRAALSRIGAAFATVDFESKRRIFNSLTPAFDNLALALQPVLDLFSEFVKVKADNLTTILDALNVANVDTTKLPVFFEGLKNIFNFLASVVRPIKEAFNTIFPPKTAEQIQKMADSFLKFTENLKMGEKSTADLKRTFEGFFAIFQIIGMIVGQVFTGFKKLFGLFGGGKTDVLGMTASVGDFILKTRDLLRDGSLLEKVFGKLQTVGQWVIDVFKNVGTAISRSVDGASFVGFWDGVKNAWTLFIDWLGKAKKWIDDTFFSTVDAVQGGFRGLSFDNLAQLLGVGALTGIGVVLYKFVTFVKGLFSGDGIGFVDAIKGAFGAIKDSLVGALEAMQTKLKAEALTKIAIAIGILAGALVLLSMIEPERLSNGIAAMAASMILLVGGLVGLDKYISTKSLAKMTGLVGVITALATAMVIMAAAMAIMATMDWNELSRGVVGLATGMGILVGAIILLDKTGVGPKMLLVAPAIQIMAQAMVILATALKIMAHLSWEEAARGVTLLAAVMAGLVTSMGLAKKVGVAGAAPMIAMAISLGIISGALKVFASMSWDEIGRAITVMVGALGALVGAMALMALLGGPGLLGAAAMIIVVGAITLLTGALKIMATMSWDDIGRTMVVLAGSLAILAGAMALMGIPLVAAGSLGIIAAAFAMMMLAPALKIMGSMSWDDIGRGLTLLGASIAILAVGGILLIPASVGFVLMGAAIMMLGTGVLLAAKGMMVFALGFATFSAAVVGGSAAVTTAISTIATAIPAIMTQVAKGFISFATEIAKGASEFAAAATVLIAALLTGIQQNGPLLIDTIWTIVLALADKAAAGVPLLVDAAYRMITGMLNVIASRIGDLITAGANIIVAVLQGIQNNAYRIADEAGRTLVSFVNALAAAVENNVPAMNRAGARLFRGIVEGVSSAIENGGDLLAWAGARIGNAIIEGAKNALSINSPSKVFRDEIMGSVFEGVEAGGDKGMGRAARSGAAIGNAIIQATSKSLSDMKNAVATDMNLQPSIRPVLDLSNVRNGAGEISNLMSLSKLSVKGQYMEASAIESQRQADSITEIATKEPQVVNKTITLNQTNTSPKALDRIEIYRQTKNIITAAEEELKKDD